MSSEAAAAEHPLWGWAVESWRWGWANLDDPVAPLLGEHLLLSSAAIAIGLAAAVPLGLLSVRYRVLYPPVLTGVNTLYAVPSLALFFLLLPYTAFSPWTAILPLALYTLAILVPNVVDGLTQVPDHVRQAAVAMGFGPLRRLLLVELPVALPVIIAGLRVASVATISMVSVASLVGLGGLGGLITDGFNRDFAAPVVVGIVLSVLLAFAADGGLVLLQRALTPWARRDTRPGRRRRAADRAARAAAAPRTAAPEPEEAP
ncbi:ABC transporter permease [Streptomonospora nanhaiensis]|uniref:Osmoprotectant transport system permease protein n=1 Tax=Streptomonospora nanhaiensis TaxID=1323731 RepID=A0A853BJY3_9ACTN|nr:ABC transporter permease [Streptomonospora nanhaiensis]MBV2365910.1 ABC transporter permease [Streptomonospora nanhaiensis]NYI95799.1 osmoprotectant transport system permease protein [Streptomonospora nanhaiensis]